MGLLNVRDLLAFPQGDNSSDTLIGGVHYNLTTLQQWNYTYYSNGTFSNGSNCWIVFEPYTPYLLPNGTFVNSTSCYSPIGGLGTRSKIGLFFACFFAASLMFTFVNLRKHGRMFLPVEKRFRPVGRRWQWYWMLAVAAFGMISALTGIDVDRYYLPQLPIVLTNFAWFLMLPTTMGAVWEAVRHWGSWQERQMVDPNPFILKQDDRRSRVEFWLPLIFYFFAWLNVFIVIPRSWGQIELQRDPDQTRLNAEPEATDIRFKTAAFCLFACWLITVFSLHHSIKHYKPRNRGLFNRIFGLIRYIPLKFLLILPISLALIGYAAACSFYFSVSPLKVNTNLGIMYGLGWGTIAAILVIFEAFGYIDPNEDRELIRQRRTRGADIDQELGITKKPQWWSRLHGDNSIGVHDQLARNVSEIGGGRATTKNLERSIELGNMPVSKQRDSDKGGVENLETLRTAANLLFPASTIVETQERFVDLPEIGRGRGRDTGGSNSETRPFRPGTSERSDSNHSTGSTVTTASRPQVIRSMLDV